MERRYESSRYVARGTGLYYDGGRSFEVLSKSGPPVQQQRPYDLLQPAPSSRAPDPYKIAPQASSTGQQRSLRKSSFAIIAEQRSDSPRSPSPVAQVPTNGASGRLSPFRGRGFKGPPPSRSRSRPQSPPDSPPPARRPRRASIGPSRIPRAARSRSTSSNKDAGETRGAASSPKFGRRATNRYVSSVANNNSNNQRRNSHVVNNIPNRFSPKKQSEPTSVRGAAARSVPDRSKSKAQDGPNRVRPPEKPNRNLLQLPAKNAGNSNRFITANKPPAAKATARTAGKAANSESQENSSKIPLRRNSLIGKSNGALNSNSPQVSTSKSTAPGASSVAVEASAVGNASKDKETSNQATSNGKTSSSSTTAKEAASEPRAEEDLGLVELLRQSSGAVGTSSVVNTTTTTAVQPLQIDAAALLSENELVTKLSALEKKQLEAESESRASEADRKNQENSARLNPTQAAAAGNAQNKKDATSGDKGRNGNMAQTMIKHFGPNSDGSQVGSPSAGVNKQAEAMKKSDGPGGTPAAGKTNDAPTKQSTEEADAESRQSSTSSRKSKETEAKAKSSSKPASSTPVPETKKAQVVPESKKSPPLPKAAAAGKPRVNGNLDPKINVVEKNGQDLVQSNTQGATSESPSSLRSTDTGVSVNTVRGVSSAKEKTGLHVVKREADIETLSANVQQLENGDHAAAETTAAAAPTSKWRRFQARCRERVCKRKNRVGATSAACCWPKMRCLACKDPKFAWPGKQARTTSTVQLTTPTEQPLTRSRWDRVKDTCRCARLRSWRFQRRRRLPQQQQVATVETVDTKPPMKWPRKQRQPKRIGQMCRNLFSCCACSLPSCRGRRQSKQSSQRGSKSVRPKHSLTSVAAPPLSEDTRPKLPDVLVEHNSVMRGAIPCLPVPLAWFCLMCNVVIPGSGTVLAGLFNLCIGQPRFNATASPKARFGAFIVDLLVGVSQLFTVLFCLVGWGWSIWWGVTMVRLASKWKRHKQQEAAANDPEARPSLETATLPAPGIAQAMRANAAAGP